MNLVFKARTKTNRGFMRGVSLALSRPPKKKSRVM